MPLKGEFGKHCLRTIGRMPSDCKLAYLDASLATSTLVLRFEDSGVHRHTTVRPVRCCCTSVFGSSDLAL
jgi:hypothetical protein